MQTRIIIAANVITLVIVAFVAIQVKDAKKESPRRGVSARTLMKQADELLGKARFKEASMAYAQVQRISKGTLKKDADVARLRADVLSLTATRALPKPISEKLPLIKGQLQRALGADSPYVSLIGLLAQREKGLLDAQQLNALESTTGVDPAIAVWARWLKANQQASNGLLESAIEGLTQITTTYPEFAEGHAALGSALSKAEQRAAAKKAYDQAAALVLARQDHLQHLKYLVESGAYSTVIERTQPGAKGLSAQQAAYFRGHAFARLGQLDEAKSAYQAFLESLPDTMHDDPRSVEAKQFLKERRPDQPNAPATDPKPQLD